MGTRYTGHSGTLTIYDTAVAIGRDTDFGRIIYGDAEVRQIPIAAVSGVAYRPAGWFKSGIIRVLVGGDTDESLETVENVDDDVIVFASGQTKVFAEAAKRIRAIASENHARGEGFAAAPPATPALPLEERQARGRLLNQERAAEIQRVEVEAGQRAGTLVESTAFGGKIVELYSGGYVQVKSPLQSAPAVYEKLRSIKFSQHIQDKSAGGRALASAATLGLSRMASNEKRMLFLIIATDHNIHNLKEVGGMARGGDTRALSLEAAGQAILAAQSPAPVQAAPSANSSEDLAGQIAKLADLHAQGILSDEEFSAAKARLLS